MRVVQVVLLLSSLQEFSALPGDSVIARINADMSSIASAVKVHVTFFPTNPVFTGMYKMRGMQANEDIEEGSLVMSLPASTIVTQDMVRRRLRDSWNATRKSHFEPKFVFASESNSLALLALHVLNLTDNRLETDIFPEVDVPSWLAGISDDVHHRMLCCHIGGAVVTAVDMVLFVRPRCNHSYMLLPRIVSKYTRIYG